MQPESNECQPVSHSVLSAKGPLVRSSSQCNLWVNAVLRGWQGSPPAMCGTAVGLFLIRA